MKQAITVENLAKARTALKVATPRRVNWQDGDDFECAHLGALGFSTTHISSHTGLSAHQITYRLHKAGIRRVDFRNGTSPFAQIVLDLTRKKTVGMLRYDLESYGKVQIGNGHDDKAA